MDGKLQDLILASMQDAGERGAEIACPIDTAPAEGWEVVCVLPPRQRPLIELSEQLSEAGREADAGTVLRLALALALDDVGFEPEAVDIGLWGDWQIAKRPREPARLILKVSALGPDDAGPGTLVSGQARRDH